MRKKMRVALVSCSNGQMLEREEDINKLINCLSDMGIESDKGKHIFAKDGVFAGTAKERADDLMAFYMDDEIDAIFDISGGDIANEILKFLDYDLIKRSEKTFWGYSDLTTVINAIYTMTGKSSVLYQVKNIIWNASLQQQRFSNSVMAGGNDLYDIRYEFLQGHCMEGIIVGGNIRCLLKLAGTKYWPDMKGKILLLEAFSGDMPQIATYFAQLDQIGVFSEISGVLLGTFTKYEQSNTNKSVYELLLPYINESLPVAKTSDVGHGLDAKAIRVGEFTRYSINHS